MDTFSETTRKERRSLLAAGYVGIVVSLLRQLPTEINLAGFKFNSPELPIVAVGTLVFSTLYFWVKFLSSYIYEQSNTETQNLFAQIRDGGITMDISKKEQELNDWARQLIQRRKILQEQREHEHKRLAQLESTYKSDSADHLESRKVVNAQESELNQELARLSRRVAEAPGFPGPSQDMDRVKGKLRRLQEDRLEYEQKHQKDREAKLEELDKERLRIKQMHETDERDIKNHEEIAIARNTTILEWKRARKIETAISPFHRFLELHFPLILGFVSIISLVWLVFHFPEPRPISLPGF